jgi:hypothetical protein
VTGFQSSRALLHEKPTQTKISVAINKEAIKHQPQEKVEIEEDAIAMEMFDLLDKAENDYFQKKNQSN